MPLHPDINPSTIEATAAAARAEAAHGAVVVELCPGDGKRYVLVLTPILSAPLVTTVDWTKRARLQNGVHPLVTPGGVVGGEWLLSLPLHGTSYPMTPEFLPFTEDYVAQRWTGGDMSAASVVAAFLEAMSL